jgi:hypothetical protein
MPNVELILYNLPNKGMPLYPDITVDTSVRIEENLTFGYKIYC